MSIDAEYERILAHLKGTSEGSKLLSSLPQISKVLYKHLSELALQHSMVQTALAVMSEEEVLRFLEKNFVLLLGRALHVARNFDALPIAAKIEKLIELLSLVKEEQERWFKEYTEQSTHIRDKAERRKRRKELLEKESVFEKRDQPLCEEWVKSLVSIFIPQGTKSLFLPAMASLFLQKNFFESLIAKNIALVMKTIHRREWKEAFLFQALTFLFHDAFVRKTFSPPLKEKVQLSESSFEKGKMITGWILDLASIVDPMVRFLAKEEATQKGVEIIANFLHGFSLERSLMYGVQSYFLKRFLIGDLDLLIDRVSGDTKTIAFLLKKVATNVMAPMELTLTPSIGDILIQGIKGAAFETAIQDKAATLVYDEIPLKIFQHIRLFVLSPFFDRVIYQSL